MRKTLSLFVILMVSSSCATRTGKVAGVIAGGSTALGAIVLASPCDGKGDECGLVNGMTASLFFGVAGIALVTAIVAEARHSASEPAPTPIAMRAIKPVAPPPRPATRPEVVELMVSASVEASVGRCITVRELAKRVEALDRDFYASVFLVDPTIQRCN
jgi:hypothetical protein